MTRITAKDLIAWAGGNNRRAQDDLPILIRRLVHTTISGASKVDFPAGDSIATPGSDGVVIVGEGNAWVPNGESLWEVSCKDGCKKKANEDCEKRAKQMSDEERTKTTFVFATPRRWPKRNEKGKWEKQKRDNHGWQSVRVLDADDLEQWIEQSPTVCAWMAEKLKFPSAFSGVFSPEKEWEKWATVTNSKLFSALILSDRQDAVKKLTEWLDNPPENLFRVIADSHEEAIAFVCAALEGRNEYFDRLLVVKSNQDEAGKLWNDEKSPPPIFMFASESYVPIGLSDKAYAIAADTKKGGSEEPKRPGFLRKTSHENFVRILVDMGYKEKEAERLARDSGRHLPILRRLLAPKDSPIAKPNWTKSENIQIMIAAALAGRWDGDSKYDVEFLARLARMDYDAFEAKIVEFVGGDDSPLQRKGSKWEVKSRIESLIGVSESIVPSTMKRFWEKAEGIFGIRNTALDLPKEMRYAANIYKKGPPYSSALLFSIADTLIMLSVHHGLLVQCQSESIDSRIHAMVRTILEKGEADRWLSLSSILSQLAEAAPNAFLNAVEKGLSPENCPVSEMFSSDAHSMFVPTYHTHLLWGLEILAWDKSHFPRIVDVLARMTDFKLPDNLADRPDNSLLSFFCAWFPQCGADVDERIVRFQQLCKRHPDVAWKICPQLLNVRWGHATHNPIPRWRDIPFHAYQQPPPADQIKMMEAIFKAALHLASGNANRINQMLDIFTSFPLAETKQFIAVIESSLTNASEEERSRVRDNICQKLGRCDLWSSNDSPPVNSKWLKKATVMYTDLRDRLTPMDLVLRHKRFFSSWYNDDVEFYEEDYQKQLERLGDARKAAIREILKSSDGEREIIRLAACCGDPRTAGLAVGQNVVKSDKARMSWVKLTHQSDMETARQVTFMRGIFAKVSDWGRFARKGFEQARLEKWGAEDIVSFALALRSCEDVWNAMESLCSVEIWSEYWRSPKSDILEEKDVARFVDETAKAGCLEIALRCASIHKFNGIDADKIISILDAILALPDNQKIQIGHRMGYDIGRALSYAAKSGVEKSVIARLEWAFYDCLETADYTPKAIRSMLANDPRFFIQAIRGLSDANVGHRWWTVLGDWDIPPGLSASGEFDEKKFHTWIADARSLARECECLDKADHEIGRILAHTPKGKDGIRPCEAVRNFIEENADMDKIARGLQASIDSPKRIRTFWGNIAEQERGRAKEFKKAADTLHLHYPRTARIYRELASGCLHSADWHEKVEKPWDDE